MSLAYPAADKMEHGPIPDGARFPNSTPEGRAIARRWLDWIETLPNASVVPDAKAAAMLAMQSASMVKGPDGGRFYSAADIRQAAADAFAAFQERLKEREAQ